MKNIPFLTRINPFSFIPRNIGWLCLIGLLLPIAGCATNPLPGSKTIGDYVLLPQQLTVIKTFPKPRRSEVTMSGRCRNTPWAFESEQVKAKWPAPGYYMPLQYFGLMYAGSRAATDEPQCADHDLMIRLWQSAIGTPITGKLSERDVDTFVRFVDAADSSYAYAANVRSGKIDREIDMFQSRAKAGDPRAQYMLGNVYRKRGDQTRAMLWYRKSAEQGFKPAQDREYFLEALAGAKKGNSDSQVSLGFSYGKGIDVPQDYSKAVYWFQKAAAQGNPMACFNIGVLYEYGKGLPKDQSKAMFWYRKAASLGSIKAQKRIDEWLHPTYTAPAYDSAPPIPVQEAMRKQREAWMKQSLRAQH